jgi:hypothetical protein
VGSIQRKHTVPPTHGLESGGGRHFAVLATAHFPVAALNTATESGSMKSAQSPSTDNEC